MKEFVVFAKWDGEAKVWVAYSDDIPGLATEADTMERLIERVTAVAPELLALNKQDSDDGELLVRAEWREHIADAA